MSTCNQKKGAGTATCDAPAAYWFTWPGQRRALICEPHGLRAKRVAESMGFDLELVPFVDDGPAPDPDERRPLVIATSFAHPYGERMSTLAESFPSLRGLAGVRPWDQEELARSCGVLSHGEQCAVRFVLGVWSGDGKYPDVDPFDFFEAMGVWDEEHREAARAWMRAPFWP